MKFHLKKTFLKVEQNRFSLHRLSKGNWFFQVVAENCHVLILLYLYKLVSSGRCLVLMLDKIGPFKQK